MFTGIIEELGTVRSIARRRDVFFLVVNASGVLEGTRQGDSIAVNGVCLTAVSAGQDSLSFEVSGHTMRETSLGKTRTGERVNLERSLVAGSRISGHFVTGHIDCVGVIRSKRSAGTSASIAISFPAQFAKFCLPRGSIAIDGISLTIAGQRRGAVTVEIIPHTLANTTLAFKGPSSSVNIEFDILAKRGT